MLANSYAPASDNIKKKDVNIPQIGIKTEAFVTKQCTIGEKHYNPLADHYRRKNGSKTHQETEGNDLALLVDPNRIPKKPRKTDEEPEEKKNHEYINPEIIDKSPYTNTIVPQTYGVPRAMQDQNISFIGREPQKFKRKRAAVRKKPKKNPVRGRQVFRHKSGYRY